MNIKKQASNEAEIYNSFALDLSRGADVVDRDTYEIIIDSRRKELIKRWLAGKKGLVLDYGCGDGSFSRFIRAELENDVIGVDLSAGMVRYASRKGEDIGYLVVDCHSLPFRDKSFDAIVAVGIFHHLDLPKAAAECNRLLRNDGFLVVFEPNSLCPLSFIGRKLFKTKIHTPNERPYTYWSFLSEIKENGFTKVELRFLSFLGFIFPFIWAKFPSVCFLKNYARFFKMIDQLSEKILFTKYLCWAFVVVGIKK